MPHTNEFWVDLASSARCAERTWSSLSNSFCGRIAAGMRSEGGVGGLLRWPSARPEFEATERVSGRKGLKVEVDGLEDDGIDEWSVDEDNCLGGAKEWWRTSEALKTIRVVVVVVAAAAA